MLQRERHRVFGALPVLPEKSPIAARPSLLDISMPAFTSAPAVALKS
jgi:hypothetical protein